MLTTAAATEPADSPAPAITTAEQGYELRLGTTLLDLVRFEDCLRESELAAGDGRDDTTLKLLQYALDLCRGPIFAGLETYHLRAAASRLEELRLTATERALALRLRTAAPVGALAELTGLVMSHPLREAPRAALMRVLHQSGRTAEALAAYEEGRRLLAGELGVEPGPDLRAARDYVRAGTTIAWPGPRVDDAAVPAKHRFLPRDTGDFTGRRSEVEQVLAWIIDRADAGPVTVAISGMGGIGKTALALHLAHLLAPGYPDGQYYLDLDGHTAGHPPVRPTAALDNLLRAAGVPPDQVCTDVRERAAQWRASVAGRRVLLVLDNSASEEQVRQLLPGEVGALVLLTSRRRLIGIEGALPVALDVLPPDDALRLFAETAGTDHSTSEATDVVELCGRLPLAIRIAASRLRHRPGWTAGYLAELLRDGRRRARVLSTGEQDVHSVIGLSLRHLDPPQRRLFGLLGLQPGPDIEPYAAAALAGVPVTDAEQYLEDMVENNLLMQRVPGRYLLHDLVRDKARAVFETESDSDQARPERRLLDYYLHLAHTACAPLASGPFRFDLTPRDPSPLLPPMPDEPATMRVLSAELANLLAITEYAGTHGWPEHTWQLPCALQPFFRRMNHRESSLRLFQRAVRAARGLGQRRGEAAALAGVAMALRERGRYPHAHTLFARAIEVSRETSDVCAEAYLRADLGICHLRAGKLEEALKCFGAARSAARATGDERGYAAFTNNVAVVATICGRLTEALDAFRQALGGYRATGFAEGEAMTLVNIGQVYARRGDCGNASHYLRSGLRRSGEIGYLVGASAALAWLAAVDRWLGDLPCAIEHAEEALAVARQARLAEAECVALNARGETELAGGDIRGARATFLAAEQVGVASGLPFGQARAREGLAHAELATGDIDAARQQWESALALYATPIQDAQGVRRHLEALGARTVSCPRCQVGRSDGAPG